MREVAILDGARDLRPAVPWPENIEDALQESKDLACRADGLEQRVVDAAWRELVFMPMNMWSGTTTCCRGTRRQGGIALSVSEVLDVIAHDFANPEAYAMSLDIAGPFEAGQDQDQGHPRYFLVSTVTIPFAEERPLMWGWRPGQNSQPDREPATEDILQDELPKLQDDADDNPFKGDDAAHITEEEIAKRDFALEVEKLKDTKVKHLTLAMPLLNRKEGNVIQAVAKLYARLLQGIADPRPENPKDPRSYFS